MTHLLTRPTQSGKTFYIINEIKEDDNEHYHIIFVSNNLLETIQINSRINDQINEKSFIFSSNNKQCKTIDSAICKFIIEEKSIMICCKNPTRVQDIDNILNKLPAKKFCMWIDEADDNLNAMIQRINKWKSLENVTKITMVTATPRKVKEYFPDIEIIEQDQSYNPQTYTSLKDDCNFIIQEEQYGMEIKGYVDYVLKKKYNRLGKINPGSNYYIPGGRTKKQHLQLKQQLVDEYLFNVLIINGDGWILYRKNGDIVPIDWNDLMPCKRIAKLYKKYKLKKDPFAVTGEICIGRGITFTSSKFQVTHGIFSHKYIDEDKSYQAAGRLTGNNKQYLKKIPKIYCTDRFKQIVIECERKAMNEN